MLIFDGLDFQTRIIKLRPRQTETCLMCKNANSKLTIEGIREILSSFDYTVFCGTSNFNDKSLNLNILDSKTERITCAQYKDIITQQESNTHMLIDVRPKCQFNICSLPNSLSIYA